MLEKMYNESGGLFYLPGKPR